MSLTNVRPEALDSALTSGLTNDSVWKAADSPHLVYEDYCDFKCRYKDTKQLCASQGLVFTPIVFDVHGGGWSPDALRILDAIAKQQVSAGFRCREGNALRIAQRLSTAIQMANSRAVLKRLPQLGNGGIPIADLADVDEDFLFQ